MFNKLSFVAGAIATATVAVAPAYAGRVLRVSAEAALDGSVPLVVHSEGGGIILDFSPTGETIQKISLDDPSKIVYDHCLLSKSCGNHPSPTVRLFRSKGIAFADLPSVKATLLTVETLDSSNEWHSYIFPVTTSSAPATYNKVLIGDTPTRNRSKFGGSLVYKTDSVNQPDSSYAITALGVRQAEQKHLLVDPQLKGRVRTYLQLTQSGMSDKLASRKAGVSLALVQHLQALGQQRADEIAAQQKATATDKVVATAPEQTQPPEQATASAIKPEDKPKHRHKSRHTDETQTPSQEVALNSAATTPPVSKPEPIKTNAPITKTDEQPEAHPQQTSIAPHPESAPVAQPPAVAPVESKTVASVLPAQPAIAKVKATTIVDRQTYANALQRGLVKARLSRQIRYGSSQWYSVNNAIRLLRRGGSLDKAIAASGMKRDGFMKLLSDGGMET